MHQAVQRRWVHWFLHPVEAQVTMSMVPEEQVEQVEEAVWIVNLVQHIDLVQEAEVISAEAEVHPGR